MRVGIVLLENNITFLLRGSQEHILNTVHLDILFLLKMTSTNINLTLGTQDCVCAYWENDTTQVSVSHASVHLVHEERSCSDQ